MYRVLRSENCEHKLKKLDNIYQQRVLKFEQELKTNPYLGKPLGFIFFREKKFNGNRLLYLIYEEHKIIFLITITNKKLQQSEINIIKKNLDKYKETINEIIKTL